MDKHYPEIGRETITMRWGDMDAVGHLNNTYYFRYLEQVRINWLDRMGLSINPESTGPVIAHTGCTFKRELTYPATVEVTIEVEKLGRSSLKLRHHFYRQGDSETVYAIGEATLVWVNYQTGQSIPLPEVIRTQVAAALAAAENQS